MIRRQVDDEYFLITQHDHALLAGQFARHFGNASFARPDPYDATIAGTSLHDSGWPMHDDHPTLNPRGLPLDVFEVSRPIALNVWTVSADRAAAQDAYAGLLTSLHVLSLSIFATTQTAMKHEKFDMTKLAEKFEINKFQHREIERQESLRKQLGLRTDLPLHHGLAPTSDDPNEQRLTHNFQLLQAMDLTSLAICCTEPPAEMSRDLATAPGEKATRLSFDRRDATTLAVDPWPFDSDAMTFGIPFRRLPARVYASEKEFQTVYLNAHVEQFSVFLVRDKHADAKNAEIAKTAKKKK